MVCDFRIPHARAETTNLLSTGNCIRFGDFQRRARGRRGWRQSTLGGDSRSDEATNDVSPGDHGKTAPTISKKDEKTPDRISAVQALRDRPGSCAKANASSRESARPRNFHDGAGAPDESADRKSNGAAWQPFQFQFSAG
jgi:hypothetical protein